MNDGFIKEAAPASTNSVLEDSLEIGQYDEGQAITNKMVEDASVEKLMKIENVTATKADCILSQELALESSKKNNDAKESECSSKAIDCEEEVDDDGTIKAMTIDGVGNEAYKHDHRAYHDMGPVWIASLENIEFLKLTMKEFAEGSSSGIVSGLRDFTNSMDGQIMLDDTKEDDDNDDGDGDNKGFDSTSLAALLERETSGTLYENITILPKIVPKYLPWMNQLVRDYQPLL